MVGDRAGILISIDMEVPRALRNGMPTRAPARPGQPREAAFPLREPHLHGT